MTSSSKHAHSGPIRGILGLVGIALVLATAGCARTAPGAVPQQTIDRLQAQARMELARWADAAGGTQGIAIVSELTGQIGDWEAALGSDNKIALMSGQIRATASLPREIPAPGEATWADGTTKTVQLLSAAQALDAIVAEGGGSDCSDCHPLLVTAARLTSGSVETSRGKATVPMWEFTIDGTAVKVTRVAVVGATTPGPPPWDPNDSDAVSIESARGTRDSKRLTVSFTGAELGADQPCGEDYPAQAVESPLAVVVIVIRQRRTGVDEACSLVGYSRTATVDLASPLGDRAVLEIQQGLPVPLEAP